MYRHSLLTLIFLFFNGAVFAESWSPVTGAERIRSLFSDKVLKGTLKKGVKAEATYNADGTGELRAWGDTFARQWRVEDDDRVCILIDGRWDCFGIAQSSDDPNRYRGTKQRTGEQVVFTVSDNELVTQPGPKVASETASQGNPGKPSADEVAKSLANPNTPLATLNFKLQYRTYEGDLPDADDQTGTTLLIQPSFPFPLGNGKSVLFRPAIPVQISQPVFTGAPGNFDDESGLGDISFDLAYASTNKDTGVMLAGGVISTLPTATDDDLGKDRFTLGPELLIGKFTSKYVIGAFPNHQWDIGGSGDADINLTSMQVFGVVLPGGGWNYGSSPIMSYDHETDDWSIPLNFTFGKTIISSAGRPWKLSAEFNYFVEAPDEFGPEWFIGFSVSPVVENIAAGWFD